MGIVEAVFHPIPHVEPNPLPGGCTGGSVPSRRGMVEVIEHARGKVFQSYKFWFDGWMEEIFHGTKQSCVEGYWVRI